MKAIISLLLICGLAFLGCHKKNDDTQNGNCAVSDEVRSRYSESAYQMMMARYMADTTLPQYRTAALSASEHDEILGYIQAVYNLAGAERDTVFSIDSITEYPVTNLYQLIMQVDPNSPEGQNLSAGRPTGNSRFDAILTAYGLDSFRTMLSSPGIKWIIARTATPHNMIQVAKELGTFPFIFQSTVDSYAGDGDRIKLTYLESFAPPSPVALDFSIGRGDCPAGCTFRRHWIFQVTECNARFAGSYQ
jgi:hypothetical protein